MSAQPEIWRVSTVEGVFQADLETLKQWIAEGCVLPTDKVSKGNLNWIEAGRVPKLKGAFSGEPAPVSEPTNTSFETLVESNSAPTNPPQSYSPPSTTWVERAQVPPPPPSATFCHNHPDADPAYVCRMCAAVFCKSCPKFVGKVPVCPLCGDLCHEYRAVTEKKERAQLQRSGFGIEDLIRAIGYPLQHKTALFGGALIYGLLLLAGGRGSACAWVMLFGCISQVITQVAWGRLNRSFMPDFSEFSGWDDLFLPGFLGVGVTIVSWGPAIVLVFALIFGGLSSSHDTKSSSFGGEDHAAESIQSEDVSVLTDPNADPAKLEEANKKLQQLRPGAGIAREAEASRAQASDPASPLTYLLPYLRARISMALLFLLFIIWGVFYYPMALTVAGYTQSFGSVINPLVGLDTIRRMGTTYFKAFGMVMMVYVVAFVVTVIVYVVTSPLALPFVGNVIGNFMNATFTFYFNLVVACILGLSLFKCADRLDISVD
jgi:hypothetical protein